MIPTRYHEEKQIFKCPLEQAFLCSKDRNPCRGKVLPGNLPSRYTRNFLLVLYRVLENPLGLSE
jgi:hypothetical protein